MAVIDDQYTDPLNVYDVSALADAELGRLLTSAPVSGDEIAATVLYRDLGAPRGGRRRRKRARPVRRRSWLRR
jgi:hypothetical protein